MPTRRDFEQELWDAFVEACGGRCNSCFKEAKLERGHILSDDDGGSSTLSNLIPVCRSCNQKNGTRFPNDLRPADWRDRFAKILLTKFGIGLGVHTQNGSAHHDGDSTDGKLRLCSWNEVTFCSAKELLPTLSYSLKLTEEKATAIVEEMALAGRASDPELKIAPPGEKRKGKLIALARRFGESEYRAACENFFYDKPWLQSGVWDAWEFLCSDFNNYMREGLAARERRRLARVREEERRQVEAHEREVEALRRTMVKHLRQVEDTDWIWEDGNREKYDDLLTRLRSASDWQLLELDADVQKMMDEVRRWIDGANDDLQRRIDDGDF